MAQVSGCVLNRKHKKRMVPWLPGPHPFGLIGSHSCLSQSTRESGSSCLLTPLLDLVPSTPAIQLYYAGDSKERMDHTKTF